MKKEDFTQEEYTLLKIMFKNMAQAIDIIYSSDTEYYIDYITLYNLANKLNIGDLFLEM